MVLVSIIIPSYNHSQFVERAINSVLNQTYTWIELIIIDDGSQDGSLEKIRKFKDRRIKLLVQSNSGAHAAINRGLELAQGDFIAILNSDDEYTPDRIEKLVYGLLDNHCDFICSWLEVIDAQGNSKGVKKGWKNMLPSWAESRKHLPAFWDLDDFKLNLISTNFVSTTSNFLFKREVYQKVGGMRVLRYAHDWDFLFRVGEWCECSIIEEPLLKYRVHGSNTISSNKKWMLFETSLVLAINLQRYSGWLQFNKEVAYTEKMAIVERLINSINVAGCETLLWPLLVYLDANKSLSPDSIIQQFYHDTRLREQFELLVLIE